MPPFLIHHPDGADMFVLAIVDGKVVVTEAVKPLRVGQAAVHAAEGNQQIAVPAGKYIAVFVRVFAISHDTL